jgi:hypothetical protein
MDVFQQQAEIKFIGSVVKQLRSDHGSAVKDLPEDELYKRVAYGIERARKKYKLTWQANLATFVILMFEIGPEFDMFPVFQKYLTDESVPPNERMGVLLKETTEVDWQNAQNASTHDTWPWNLL